MTSEHVLITSAAVALPALAGAFLLAFPRLVRQSRAIGVVGSLGAVALSSWLLADGAAGVAVAWEWAPALWVRIAWRLDVATLALATLVSGVGALVLHAAGAYFGPSHKGRRAIALLCIFQASMLGLVLADELLLLFTFWELTGLCSFFLIGTDADKRNDTFASAQQALIVTVAGALPMLVGFLYLIFETGTGSLSTLVTLDLAPGVQTLALALILPGVLTKSAQVPFHFWLPGAMAAPTPISAYLHSATMVKAGLILLLYLFPVCGDSALWSGVLVPLGAATCLWGSYQALWQNDIKVLMAWSTVSQLGLIAITAGLGTDLAIRAAVLCLLAHAIFKAGLFLGIGAIESATGTRELSRLGGLGRRAPLLCGVVAVLAGSMAGLPPFSGFLSKELVLKKLMLADTAIHDIAVIGIVLGSMGTVAYTARFFFGCFAGSPRSDGASAPRRVRLGLILPPGLLAAVSLAAGLLAVFTDRWILEPMSAALLGYPLDAPELRLWHGINVPLVLSAVIVMLGFLLYRYNEHRRLPAPPEALGGERLFAGFLARAQALGALCNRGLAGAPPSVYTGLLLAFALVWALPLAGQLADAMASGWDPGGAIVLVLLSFALVLLLAVRFVAARTLLAEASRVVQGARLVFAAVLGIAAAGLVVALHAVVPDTRLSDFYFEAGPTLAKGHNLVNLVLGDFRALDTLVETLVVLVTAFGVIALLRGREVPPRHGVQP
jgi:multicomponent Na+:H+ antiporter subunit A